MSVVTVGAPASAEGVFTLPHIRRLRICLLGGDTFVHGVGKTDVASALLKGFTTDQPGSADPTLDLVFDHGVFEQAWAKLVVDPFAEEPNCERWGIGPVDAWQGRLRFDNPSSGETARPYDPGPAEEYASLCAGNSDKLTIGHKKSTGNLKALRDILEAAGHEVDGFDELHRDMYSLAEAKPRELVRRERSLPGLIASFARFSPEIGDFAGCRAAILHIFKPDARPRGSSKHVGMMYAVAPNTKLHKGLIAGQFVSALRAAASNISRMVREYNRFASQCAPESWERSSWLRADICAQVECLMSDSSLKAEPELRQKIASAAEGWLDLEFIKCASREAEVLDALSASTCVETKVADDGRVFVRRVGGKAVPASNDTIISTGKRKLDQADSNDLTCWDFKRGFCQRGAQCRYLHALPPELIQALVATAGVASDIGMSADCMRGVGTVLQNSGSDVSEVIRKPVSDSRVVDPPARPASETALPSVTTEAVPGLSQEETDEKHQKLLARQRRFEGW